MQQVAGDEALIFGRLTALLFNVSPLDPWSYSIATLCVIGIAWIACYVPSRRAAVVNPVDALRAE
jgi:ABC-type antimicrobial peptide transport system permease subunit